MKQIISIIMSALLIVGVVGYMPRPNAEYYFADGYNGSTYEYSSTETIDYATKSDNEISITGSLPKYYNDGTYRNTCANVAGAIILGYYDKSYDELIPNFQAARIIRDKILYAAQTVAVQEVIDELYIKMDTNIGGNGTTIEGFQNGLKNYANQQGRDVIYSSLVTREQLNIDDYKMAINNKKPVVLFVSKYTMIDLFGIEESSKSDKLNKLHYGGDHVLVGYGIREIRYYNSNGSLKKEVTLLMVATGYMQDQLAYVMLDDRMRIVDGYEINIY